MLDLLVSRTCTVKADAPRIKTPQTARFIDSGTLVINDANLASYKDDLKKVTADIQSKFKTTLSDLQVSARRLRMAATGSEIEDRVPAR